jgi:hypothetical protein
LLDDLGVWLRGQRLARGWAVADMARHLRHAGKETGDNHLPGAATVAAYIRRWERGVIAPSERYQLLYGAALGIPPGEFGPGQSHQRPPGSADSSGSISRSAPAGAPGDSPRGSRARGSGGCRACRKEYDAARQLGQPAPVAASLDQLMAVIADESLELGEWVGMSEVADTTIDRYSGQVRELARGFESAPPLPLLLETRRLRDRVAAVLRGHLRLDQARDLYLLGAQVCGLLAWMTGDLGNFRAADTHAWTAWLCAEQAGHDGARAWVRATQAKLAYWDGRYAESAQLAEHGLTFGSGDTARTFLALFQARALAQAGRRDEARLALGQAGTERGQVTAPDLTGGVWGLTPGRYHGMAASTRMLLDEPAQVLADASEAITLSESAPAGERHIYSEMLARIDQAQAHLHQPDLDGARSALRPVLELHPDSRIEPLIRRLARLRPALTTPLLASAARARDLQEEIETYVLEAIPRAVSA